MDLQSILSILHSNEPPSNSEAVQIESLVNSRRRDLDKLDSEIKETKDRLASLETNHRQISSALASYEAALSPLRHVPPEILSEIFLKCVQDKPPLFPWKRCNAPFSLTLVCSRWRHAALQTPQVCCTISLG